LQQHRQIQPSLQINQSASTAANTEATLVDQQLSPGVIQRALDTNGGEFHVKKNDVLGDIGLTFELEFEPKAPTESPMIAMIQTSRAMIDGKPDYGDRDGEIRSIGEQVPINSQEENFEDVPDPGHLNLGTHIDRAEDNNPLYGTQSGDSNMDLKDSEFRANARPGKRIRKDGDEFEVVNAYLWDQPQLIWDKGPTGFHSFETTAMCIGGDLDGTFLGSVTWGYKRIKEQKGLFEEYKIHPYDVHVASKGQPTETWFKAAKLWNTTKVTHAEQQTVEDEDGWEETKKVDKVIGSRIKIPFK
jgi:hypothetical protein